MSSAAPLAQLAAEPERAALFLDVDGTLAPIVPRPEDAVLPQETRAELRRLTARYALVACVSGRTGADAERIVAVDGIRYVGEHGLELEPEASEWAARIHRFARTVDWPVESKPLTVAFHYRLAADPDAARVILERVAEAAVGEGLRPRWGRMVLEVRPPLDINKGTAVRTLLREQGLRRALYAGDDTTDLDAFRGLDGLELAIRVAISSAEAPTDLGAAADLVLGDPAALLQLLRQL